MLLEEVEGLLLLCLVYESTDVARFLGEFDLCIDTADVFCNMVYISLVLAYNLVVDGGKVGVRLVRSCSPVFDVIHYDLEVAHAYLVALDLVHAKVFALVTRV